MREITEVANEVERRGWVEYMRTPNSECERADFQRAWPRAGTWLLAALGMGRDRRVDRQRAAQAGPRMRLAAGEPVKCSPHAAVAPIDLRAHKMQQPKTASNLAQPSAYGFYSNVNPNGRRTSPSR